MKGLISQCGAEATAQCVYCARPFCRRHGFILDDGHEICTRKNCVAKKEDLERHLEYKAFVLQRNRGRLCGIEICVEEFVAQCRRCQGYYCRGHLLLSEEVAPEGQPSTECRHCRERRPIWTRD